MCARGGGKGCWLRGAYGANSCMALACGNEEALDGGFEWLIVEPVLWVFFRVESGEVQGVAPAVPPRRPAPPTIPVPSAKEAELADGCCCGDDSDCRRL